MNYRYEVQGPGQFPDDMLRYDQAKIRKMTEDEVWKWWERKQAARKAATARTKVEKRRSGGFKFGGFINRR